MVKDEFLKLRFACGSQTALEEIYEAYQNDLLTVAMALLNASLTQVGPRPTESLMQGLYENVGL
jgi:hypothetical protein